MLAVFEHAISISQPFTSTSTLNFVTIEGHSSTAATVFVSSTYCPPNLDRNATTCSELSSIARIPDFSPIEINHDFQHVLRHSTCSTCKHSMHE